MNFRQLFSLPVALLVGILATTSPSASGAIISVTTAADTIDGMDGVVSLREAFMAANSIAGDDIIVLQAGQLYILDFCAAGTLEHTDAASLTLQGNGAIIQNTCIDLGTIESSHPDGSLTVDDVTMTGFAGTAFLQEAAINDAAGNTIISNCNIHGFSGAPGSDVINGGDGPAGSIGASLTITNSEIWGNIGHGIRISFGNVTITNSMIYDHTGAGVNLTDGTPLVITNSSIYDNDGIGVRTTGQGSSMATLTDVTITGNGDTGFGCFGCGNISINNSVISNNGLTAPGNGGGGFRVTYDQDEPGDVRSTTIVDSTIDDNSSNHAGGGIQIAILESTEPTAPPATLDIQNTSVSNNVVTGPFLSGGGIHVATGGLYLTDNSSVVGNATGAGGNGGGIFVAEQGVISTPASINITDASVVGNTANFEGGGVHLTTSGLITITDSEISGNTAETLDAGGVFVADGDALITATTIDGNTAAVAGGGITFSSTGASAGVLSLVDSTVSNNSAPFRPVGNGDDWIDAGPDGDTVFGGLGRDHIDGGPGRDRRIPFGGTTENCP